MGSLMPRPLHHRKKSAGYPLNRRLGGPQSWSGHYGDKGKSVVFVGIRIALCPPPSPELSQDAVLFKLPSPLSVQLSYTVHK